MVHLLTWDGLVDAAQRSSWITYVGTADAEGRPHVAVAAPGFTPGTLWFVTRTTSRKYRNLLANPEIAFHWPVENGDAPGELAAWGRATLHAGDDDRHRLWEAGIMPYDLAQFFGSPDNAEVAFVASAIRRARLQTADPTPHVYEA